MRKGRGCVDQIFSFRIISEKIMAKGRKGYAALISLEEAYGTIDRKALWDVLRVYGMGGKLLNGVQAFYKEAKVCIRVKGELSESFGGQRGVRRTGMCDVPMVI